MSSNSAISSVGKIQESILFVINVTHFSLIDLYNGYDFLFSMKSTCVDPHSATISSIIPPLPLLP